MLDTTSALFGLNAEQVLILTVALAVPEQLPVFPVTV